MKNKDFKAITKQELSKIINKLSEKEAKEFLLDVLIDSQKTSKSIDELSEKMNLFTRLNLANRL